MERNRWRWKPPATEVRTKFLPDPAQAQRIKVLEKSLQAMTEVAFERIKEIDDLHSKLEKTEADLKTAEKSRNYYKGRYEALKTKEQEES